jgi:hypothetical protein
VPRDKDKQRQTSPEQDVQEYEEQQAKEKQEAEERAAAAEADLMPHKRAHLVAANRETASRMQELAAEWKKDIEEAQTVEEAQKNVEHVEELRAKIAAGTATPDDMAEAADSLHHGVSPDDEDVAGCDSEDKSSVEGEEEKAMVGTKRKRTAKKTEWKRAEQKTEAGTEKRRGGGKPKWWSLHLSGRS